MSDDDQRWYKCLECDDFGVEFAFYNPDTVYCEGCDTKVGETDQPVEADVCAFTYDAVVNPSSGEQLATVEYDDDWVEIHGSVAVTGDGLEERDSE